MSKKFRCGRLLQTKDGRIKKIDLGNGGGTRTCDCSRENMTFDEVHRQLRIIFSLDDQKHETRLYDFKLEPLDVKQFSTFDDYMKQYGLNRNSTVVYLCTFEEPNAISKRSTIENDSKNLPLPPPPPIVKSEPEQVSAEDDRSASSSEFSFTDTSLDLMKYIRELISQSPSNRILAQLFEKLCLIHGHVVSIILPLQQLNEHSNESERILYLHNLNNVHDIFDSTKALLDRNRIRFRHMQLFSLIQTTFLEFYNHLQILRNRWTITEEKKPHVDTGLLVSTDTAGVEMNPSTSQSRNSRKKNQYDSVKLFDPVLSVLTCLLRLTKSRGLRSFQRFTQQTIGTVKSLRNNLDLSDQLSIDRTRKALLTIKSQLANKQREMGTDSIRTRADRSFYRIHSSSIRVLRSVLTSLYTKEAKILQRRQAMASKS